MAASSALCIAEGCRTENSSGMGNLVQLGDLFISVHALFRSQGHSPGHSFIRPLHGDRSVWNPVIVQQFRPFFEQMWNFSFISPHLCSCTHTRQDLILGFRTVEQ
jgi:hypothetical protein